MWSAVGRASPFLPDCVVDELKPTGGGSAPFDFREGFEHPFSTSGADSQTPGGAVTPAMHGRWERDGVGFAAAEVHMFVQVILGRVADTGRLRERWEAWAEHLAPGADGWIGSTAGITGDGDFVLVARFDSEAAARRNSARTEQDTWWHETVSALDGDPEFHDSADVSVAIGAPSDDAGFVQVMRARVGDRARFVNIEEQLAGPFHRARPDLLGALRAWHADGTLTAVDWFSSVAEARAGERQDMSEQLRTLFGQWQEQLVDTRWFDLPDPWHASPRTG
jgi:hypothetical protein